MDGESEGAEPVAGSGPARRPAPGRGSDRAARPLEAGAERVLIASLRVTLVPVAFLALAGFGAFAYGIAVFIHSIDSIVSHPFPVSHQVGFFLLDIDLFLVGVTLLISAIGLYELFIRDIPSDHATGLPPWLEIHDLNDLKGRVIAMIVLVLSVSFVEVAVDSPDGLEVLELGAGAALVIVALTVFVRLTGHMD
jgi:uncharacterized membrane protein YqhA